MGNENLLLSPDFISATHSRSLSALATVQATGLLASAACIDQPGSYRKANVIIKASQHLPPPALRVPNMITAMCDYLNSYWQQMDPVDIASIVLWRINWIHPFRDGNGRTARALTRHTVARCYKLKLSPAFDELIIADRDAYLHALRSEDEAQGDSTDINSPSVAMRTFMTEIVAKNTPVINYR